MATGSEVGNSTQAKIELDHMVLHCHGATPAKPGAFGGSHYLIEAAIPWCLLTLANRNLQNETILVHRITACADDSVDVYPTGNVPVPPTKLLLGAALSLVIRQRRA